MRLIGAGEVEAGLPWPRLLDGLRAGITGAWHAPERTRIDIPLASGTDAALLLMPAWQQDGLIGVKLVTFFPDAEQRINASYVMFDGNDGRLLAVIDGDALTLKRTAGASLVAARMMAREDARTHLIVGTGKLADTFARAFAAELGIEEIVICGRQPENIEALVRRLRADGLPARRSNDIAREVGRSDIVSCVTSASEPVLRGEWLRPGTHVDLVGSFRPDMREADDEVFRRATRIVVDFPAALQESGDLIAPRASGALDDEKLVGDLADLLSGRIAGRESAEDLTIFKSVGHACEDLAAAALLMEATGTAGSV